MTKLVNPDALAVTLTADPPLPAGFALDGANVEIDFTKASAALGRFTTHRITASKPDSRTAEWVQTLGASIVPPGSSTPPTLGSDITAASWTRSTGGTGGAGDANPLVWNSPATEFGHVYAAMSVEAGKTYLVSGVVTIGAVAPSLEFRVRVARGATVSTAGTILASATIAAPQPYAAYDTGAAAFTGLSNFTFLPGYGLLWTAPATETVYVMVQQKNVAPFASANFSIANAANGGLRVREYTPGAISRPRGPIVFSGAGAYGGDPDAAYARDLLAEFANAEQVVPATMLPLWATLDNGVLSGAPPEGVYDFSLEARNEDTTLVVPMSFSAPGLPQYVDAYWDVAPALSPAGVPIFQGDPVRLVAGAPAGDGPFAIVISGAAAPSGFGVDVTPAVGDYVWTVSLTGASGEELLLDIPVKVETRVTPPQPGNLIANGAFDADLAGWTLTNTSTGALRPVWDAGRARLQRIDFNDTAVLRQQVAVTANAAATLTLKLQAAAGTVYPRVYVGTTAGGSQVLAGNPTVTTTQQTFTFNFTPTVATIWLDIYPPGNGTTFFADDVTLTQDVLAGATWGDNGDENMRLTLAAPLPAGWTARARTWNAGTAEPTTALGLMTEGATRALWSCWQGFRFGGPTPRNGRIEIVDNAGKLVSTALFASQGSPGAWTTVPGAAGPGAVVAQIAAPAVVNPLPLQKIASGGAISLDVSGVFSTGTAGLTVAGLPTGASYSAGVISAAAGAVADGSYTITLTATNAVAHNGAGGTTSATVVVEVGEIVVDPGDFIDPGPVASLSARSAGVSRSVVSGYERFTLDGAQTEYGVTAPVGVTPMGEYRLRMTVDTAGVPAGYPIHVRAARSQHAQDGESESDAGVDSAWFETALYGGTGVHAVEFWFIPTAATVHVGVRVGRKSTGFNWTTRQRNFAAIPAAAWVAVKDVSVNYAPPALAVGASGALSEIRVGSAVYRFSKPVTARRAPTGHYVVAADATANVVSVSPPSGATPLVPVSISGASQTSAVAHGLMVDYRNTGESVGFDERWAAQTTKTPYTGSKNLDPAIAGPIGLGAAKALRKAVSFGYIMGKGARQLIQQFADLYVASALPAAGKLPPTHFASPDATAFSESDFAFDKLLSLPLPAGAEDWREAAWRVLGTDQNLNFFNPPAGMFGCRIDGGAYRNSTLTTYGSVFCHLFGDQMPVEVKRLVAMRLAHAGLQAAGLRAANSYWACYGGASWLQKPFVLFAAAMLEDAPASAAKTALMDALALGYQEDTMGQYLTAGRISRPVKSGEVAFSTPMLGIPEFAQHPNSQKTIDPNYWTSGVVPSTPTGEGAGTETGYKLLNFLQPLGQRLMAELLEGASALWTPHRAALDFCDRINAVAWRQEGGLSRNRSEAAQPWVTEFWRAQRSRNAPASLHQWGLQFGARYSGPALVTCRVGQAFSYDVRAREFGADIFTGGRIPTSFALRSSWSGSQAVGTVTTSLPAGLSLNASTGVISGTPSGATGLLTFVVRGTHGASGTWADAVVKLQVTT